MVDGKEPEENKAEEGKEYAPPGENEGEEDMQEPVAVEDISI